MSLATDRIVFAGSPEFAAVQLRALLDAGATVVGVLSQPDRPAGRRRRPTPTAVSRLAQEADLPLATPPGLRRETHRGTLADWAPDVLVVAAYGLILPPPVLALPSGGCLNVHASLLPRWRGAAPVERAIMAGDERTGVCIMDMEAGLDTGPVRHRLETPIEPGDTGGTVEARLARLGARALVEVLAAPERFPPEPQPDAGVTWAGKLGREDARLDFGEPAAVLARRIRALNPRMPVRVRIGAEASATELRLLRATPDSGVAGDPGTLVGVDRTGLAIACGDGVLRVTEVQRVGGKGTVLAGADLANGLRGLEPGSRVHAL